MSYIEFRHTNTQKQKSFYDDPTNDLSAANLHHRIISLNLQEVEIVPKSKQFRTHSSIAAVTNK